MKITGKRAFVWQTLSASYLAIYTPYLGWLSLTRSIQTIADLLQPSLLIPSLIALGLLLIHAWIGLRDVLIDYFPRAHLTWLLPSVVITLGLIALNLIGLVAIGLTQ